MGLDWEDWIRRHMTLMGYAAGDEREVETLWSWTDQWARVGLTPAQLMAASERLVSRGAPKYRGAMLEALQRALEALADEERSKRTDLLLRSRPGASGAQCEPCLLCGDSGWVVVPRLDHVRGGVWLPSRLTSGTAVVTCRCPLGHWLFERHRGREPSPPMALEDYEGHNPGWKVQARLRRESAGRLSGARHAARTLDASRGEIRNLAARTHVPRE